MTKKKVAPAKTKSKTVPGKSQIKPTTSAKTAKSVKKPAPKLVAYSGMKKGVTSAKVANNKTTVKSTVKQSVKVAAAPVKPVARVMPAPKVIGKKLVAQKPQSVVSAHPRPATPFKMATAQIKAAHAAPAAALKAPVHVQPLAAARQPARSVAAAVVKPFGQKISAPPMASKPITPKQLADRAAAVQQQLAAAALKKPISQRHGFKKDEFVVYPSHGVGRIVGIEEQEIAGMALELFVISFEKDKMTLRVPTGKLASVGMRKLAEEGIVRRAMETLKGRARIKRTMWSRRAQEYEAKINSGDLVAIAEVVRDLYRSEQQPEQSYSERQLYEAALDRMAREIAAVDKLDDRGAVQRITEVLSRSAKGRRLAAEAAEAAVAEVVKAA